MFRRKFIAGLVVFFAVGFLLIFPFRSDSSGKDDKKYVEEFDAYAEFNSKFPEVVVKKNLDLRDFHLPRLTFESEDAKKVNNEVQELVNKIIKQLEEYDFEGTLYADFTSYLYEDYFSLYFYCDFFGMEEPMNLNRVYCFKMPEGRIVSNDEILKELGVDVDMKTVTRDTLLINNPKFSPCYELLDEFALEMLEETFEINEKEDLSTLFFDNSGRLMINVIVSQNGMLTGHTQLEALIRPSLSK